MHLLNGVIILDKPPGPSSAAALNRVKRLLPRGTRIGHAGTLDPFASGVLLLLVGDATKSSQNVMDLPKSYDATVKLGANTPTDDIESEEIPVADAIPPSLLQIRHSTDELTGIIQQVPPAFSAKKIAGRRACDLIRQGKTIHLKPNSVRVDRIEILDWNWPLLKLRVDCGKGTYIRAIARDLGRLLNTGGYLTELRRTGIGPFTIDKSVTLDRLAADGIKVHLRPANSP
jgi:tRNA pseudouridine55 synthase